VGFVAIEKSDKYLFFMEKLAVLPEYRHNGYGSRLIGFVVETVKKAGGKKISIGIINENKVLKDWYIQNGFSVSIIKQFPHLPFDVCFLERAV
jgi:ribosomal protein S18 acetylase RimI-like enzyme